MPQALANIELPHSTPVFDSLLSYTADLISITLATHQSPAEARAVIFILTNSSIVLHDDVVIGPLDEEETATVLAQGQFGLKQRHSYPMAADLTSKSFWLGFICANDNSIFGVRSHDQHLINLMRFKLQDSPKVEQVIM